MAVSLSPWNHGEVWVDFEELRETDIIRVALVRREEEGVSRLVSIGWNVHDEVTRVVEDPILV